MINATARESQGNLLLANAYTRIAGQIIKEAAPSLEGINFNKQFYAVAGNHVYQRPPRQELGDLSALMAQAEDSEAEFLHIVQEYARKSGAIGHQGVLFKRGIRAQTKADSDYGGDASRVCDLLRTTIEVDSPAQIIKIGNLLRPSNNSSVIRFENGFERPDEDSGMRRILCNIRLPNGHVCEIQVRHKGMEKAYLSSEQDYLRVRAGRTRMEDINNGKETASDDEKKKLWAMVNHHQTKRLEKHAKAAAKHGLDALVVKHDFTFVDGFPVIHATTANGEESALIADVQTGKFVIDNRFLPWLTSRDRQVSHNVPRDTFMERAMGIVISPVARKFLELADRSSGQHGHAHEMN